MAGDKWVQQHSQHWCCDIRLLNTPHLAGAAQASGGMSLQVSKAMWMWHLGTRVRGGLASARGMVGLYPGTLKVGKTL